MQPFSIKLNSDNWESNIESIKKAALYMRTEKRGADTYCIGSTRGDTAFPLFEYKTNMYDSLPRYLTTYQNQLMKYGRLCKKIGLYQLQMKSTN